MTVRREHQHLDFVGIFNSLLLTNHSVADLSVFLGKLLNGPEADIEEYMNEYFRRNGWRIHSQVEGENWKGDQVRIDTVLEMHREVLNQHPEYEPARYLGIEYKSLRKADTEFAEISLPQCVDYTKTLWELPDWQGGVEKVTTPIFLCPSWRSAVGGSEGYGPKVDYVLHKFLGGLGVGQCEFRHHKRNGQTETRLIMRNELVWSSSGDSFSGEDPGGRFGKMAKSKGLIPVPGRR